MMPENNGPTSNRIPIRFVDDERLISQSDDDEQSRPDAESDTSAPSAGELGRASSYEDETEMQRRINRGEAEDQENADDEDVAGGPSMNEIPERREDRDETPAGGDATQQAADETPPAPSTPQAYGPMLAELIATRAELKRVEVERDELRDSLARRQADFDNYRKRVERERTETYNRLVADVVGQLLPVLDNLRRALDAEASQEAAESEEFRHFLHGVRLIFKQLNNVLEGLGLQPIEAVGHPFDPHIHEAVATEPSDEFEPDTVTQEIVRGYRLGEKLLRPAIVKVATKQ